MKQLLERYEQSGVDGLKRTSKSYRYSKEFKLEVICIYFIGGTPYSKFASQYYISNVSVIYQWVSQYTRGSIQVAKYNRKAEKKKFILTNKLWTANANHDFHANRSDKA